MRYWEVVNGRGMIIAAGLTEAEAHSLAVKYNKAEPRHSPKAGAYSRETRRSNAA
jgi:hypothetical protein